jgi:uncharacterized membrane protein
VNPLVHLLALETGVQSAVVTATGTIIVALVGVALELLRRSHQRLGEVKEQVQNSHGTNLRDDLDQVVATVSRIESAQTLNTGAITELRAELRHERVERHDLERRVDRLYEP